MESTQDSVTLLVHENRIVLAVWSDDVFDIKRLCRLQVFGSAPLALPPNSSSLVVFSNKVDNQTARGKLPATSLIPYLLRSGLTQEEVERILENPDIEPIIPRHLLQQLNAQYKY